MTAKELYEWAKENNVEDYDITVLNTDGSRHITQSVESSVDINHAYREIEL